MTGVMGRRCGDYRGRRAAEVEAFRGRAEARRLDRVLSRAQIDSGAAKGKIDPAGKQTPSDVDEDEAIHAALQAFEDGLYLVVVDGQEERDLDARRGGRAGQHGDVFEAHAARRWVLTRGPICGSPRRLLACVRRPNRSGGRWMLSYEQAQLKLAEFHARGIIDRLSVASTASRRRSSICESFLEPATARKTSSTRSRRPTPATGAMRTGRALRVAPCRPTPRPAFKALFGSLAPAAGLAWDRMGERSHIDGRAPPLPRPHRPACPAIPERRLAEQDRIACSRIPPTGPWLAAWAGHVGQWHVGRRSGVAHRPARSTPAVTRASRPSRPCSAAPRRDEVCRHGAARLRAARLAPLRGLGVPEGCSWPRSGRRACDRPSSRTPMIRTRMPSASCSASCVTTTCSASRRPPGRSGSGSASCGTPRARGCCARSSTTPSRFWTTPRPQGRGRDRVVVQARCSVSGACGPKRPRMS